MSKDKNVVGEGSMEFDPKLHMEAMMGEMKRILRLEMDRVHARMERMENSRLE